MVILDADDAERLGDLGWYVITTKQGKRYAVAHGESGTLLYLHREVLGSLPGRAQVDHKNGETLDCRRSNLRVATPRQQRANSRKRADRAYSSSLKGVTKHRCGRWVAQANGRYLGMFATEEAAARAYDVAALAEFDEFARLNFPEEVSS